MGLFDFLAPKKKRSEAANRKRQNINRKVNAYNKGNKAALNNVPFKDLVQWAIKSNRLSPSGPTYKKNLLRGWVGVNSGRRVNKNTIKTNLNLSRY